MIFDEDFFTDKECNDDGVIISSICLDQDEDIKQCNFPKERFVPPPAELEHSVIDISLDDESNQFAG